VKEHAKRRNTELLGVQKRLIITGRQLEHEAEQLFGAKIAQAVARMEAMEQENEKLRQENTEIENDIRCIAIERVTHDFTP